LRASTFAQRSAAVLALAGWLGCTSPAGQPERSVLLGAENRVFLILPLNVAIAMPPELELASPVVWVVLEDYLRAHQKQLKTVNFETARGLWLRSIQAARAGEKGARAGYDDAAGALAVELRKHAEFDALIAPSLVVRQALITHRSARWDGVEREVEIEAEGLEARSLASTPLEGVAPAATLHVAVFSATGEKLHEAKGGLDLLVRIRVEGEDPSGLPSFRFVPRPAPFESREHVREGVAAALLPLLPPLAE
jgi:hypothetical protein